MCNECCEGIGGSADVKAEQVSGLPLLTVEPRRTQLARYGLTVADVQNVVSAAIGGRETGLIYEGDARYPIEVRLPESLRVDPQALTRLPLIAPEWGLRAVRGGGPDQLGTGSEPDLAR